MTERENENVETNQLSFKLKIMPVQFNIRITKDIIEHCKIAGLKMTTGRSGEIVLSHMP
jgi:hypothetical protein